ncbi:MAG: EAL domain-containing protein, partial [Pseudomonadota bacterium]
MTEMSRPAIGASADQDSDEGCHGLILVEIDDFCALEELYGESVASGVIYGAETCVWAALPKGSGTWHAARGQFAISMPDTTLTALSATATKVQGAIERTPQAVPQGSLSITASAGVAIASADRLIELGPAARRALSAAQAMGRGRQSTASAGDDTIAMRHRRAERALYAKEIHLVFQPVERAHGTAPVAWRECLARLPNDGAPLDVAADFMPHLIQAGHAPALDRLVLERAAILMMGRPTLRLSINVAGPTLADNGFHDRLDALRTDDPTLCDRLIIEVDASDIAREPHRLRRFIERLRQSGTGLAIDNMATGRDDQAQDEMAALAEFRPDFIKIPFNTEAPPAYRSALIGQALSHDTGV